MKTIHSTPRKPSTPPRIPRLACALLVGLAITGLATTPAAAESPVQTALRPAGDSTYPAANVPATRPHYNGHRGHGTAPAHGSTSYDRAPAYDRAPSLPNYSNLFNRQGDPAGAVPANGHIDHLATTPGHGYDNRHESTSRRRRSIPQEDAVPSNVNQYNVNRYPTDGHFGAPVDARPVDVRPIDRSVPPTFNDNRRPTQPGYSNTYERPQESEAEATQKKQTYRYSDTRMLRFLNSSSLNLLMSMYVESAVLIDERHVDQIGYEVRTAKALSNLSHALENPAFLRAAGGNPSPQQVQQLRAEIDRLKGYRTRDAQSAVGVMGQVAESANRMAGLKKQVVAAEFLSGTLDSLDKYSAFVPAQTAYGPSAGLEEHIVGIGVELKTDDNGALIMGVVDGGPAQEARLQKGDVIVGVNGTDVRGTDLNRIADLIAGPSGSDVLLKVERNGYEGIVSMRRRSVYVSSVTDAQMIDPQQKVGYVRLKQFSESSSEDLEKAMWSLYREGMQSMILDLRGNPGGLLTTSISMSNKFLPSGSIVSTRGRNADDNTHETASFERTWKMPLILLVDGNSASASEILAAAIQENRRGVIVGRQSYGKGTVQTHFPMRSVSGDLKLTTAKFYSPTGREMAGAGVTPDVIVANGDSFASDRLSADADIQAALRTFQSGEPGQLAGQSARSRQQFGSTR